MEMDVSPKKMQITAPKEEPDDTPMIPGSAKGLEKTPCITNGPCGGQGGAGKKGDKDTRHADAPENSGLLRGESISGKRNAKK